MEVVVVTSSFPRYPGDFAGNFILDQLKWFREAGKVNPTVIAPHDQGIKRYEELDGIPVHRFIYASPPLEVLAYHGGLASKKGNMRYYALFPSFLGVMTANTISLSSKAELVHAHWLLSGLSAMMSATVTRTPYIVTAHGSDVNLLPRGGWQSKIAARVIRRAAAVIAVSPPIKEKLLSLVPDANVHFIPNGVSNKFLSGPKEPNENLVVGFVGRLVREKGVAQMLKAVEAMKDIELRIVGDGPLSKEVAVAASKNKNIKYLGQMPPSKMPKFYRDIDALLLPSHMEGMPMTVLEAMASGKVVVATAVGGIPEILDRGKCGIFIEDTAESIRSALEILSSDRELYMKKARAGHLRAKSEYMLDSVARKIMNIYRMVI